MQDNYSIQQFDSLLFKRYEKNPILAPNMWPYRINSVFNPGAIEYNGYIYLLTRIEDMRGSSHFNLVKSKDGITNWEISSSPTMIPESEIYPEEHYGIEDPRIVKIEDENRYAIVYCSYSKGGPLVSLATTEDFKTFNKCGAIMPPEDKDASLFPKKFNGRYALIHRPVSHMETGAHIWIAFSSDLKHWGENKVLLNAKMGGWWDANKIGLGPQPIETEEGWLIIYHGVRKHASGSIYRTGLALLDLDDPTVVIKRCDDWVFGPRESYEILGDVPYVAFPCGVVVRGDTLYMYYGAADTVIALAFGSVKEILEYIKKS